MFFLHSVPFSLLASLLGVRTRGALLVKYKNCRRVSVRFKRNYVFTFFFLQELKKKNQTSRFATPILGGIIFCLLGMGLWAWARCFLYISSYLASYMKLYWLNACTSFIYWYGMLIPRHRAAGHAIKIFFFFKKARLWFDDRPTYWFLTSQVRYPSPSPSSFS